MKLNKEKNIKLCQKALYAKQLQYYSKLCELYAELATLKGFDTTPEAIQQAYSAPLSAAVAGKDFTDIGNAPYSPAELEIFKQYAFCSKRLNQFKKAASKLEKAINHKYDEGYIDSSAIADYDFFMQNTSKSTKSFHDYIDESSPALIGHKYFVATNIALDKIREIDQNHLSPKSILDYLTPANFGATIVGFKSPKEVIWDAEEREDPDDELNYSNEPNKLASAAYTLGRKAQKKTAQVYKANKTKVRATIAAVLAASALYSTAAHIHSVSEYNNLSVTTNQEQGYNLYISDETKAMLSRIRQNIENCQNSSTIPSYEEIQEIRDDLDDVIDFVMGDLTKQAFEEANPDCHVTNVETAYDKTPRSANNEPTPEYTCRIDYTDGKGREDSVIINEFKSLPIFSNNTDIEQSYENEYTLDYKNNAYSIYYNSNASYLERTEQIANLLESYKTILEETEHLAGTKMIYNNGFLIIPPSIKTTIPDKVNSKDKTDSDIERD